MSLLRIEIAPQAPFFNSVYTRARKAAPVVHSDTLHAALCAVAAVSGENALLDAAQALRVSALYPCFEGIHFYPRPYLKMPGVAAEEEAGGGTAARKRWKSTRLVSESVLKAWLSSDASLPNKAILLPGGLAVLESESGPLSTLRRPWMTTETRPSVTVDRWLVNTAEPGAAGTNVFQRNSLRINTADGFRLYFLAEVPSELHDAFTRTLELLGESGLGGDRSTGFGVFSVEAVEPFTLPTFSGTANAFLALGLYLPTREEVAGGVLGNGAAYDCVVRGGWTHGPGGANGMKRRVRMCLEGSVLAAPGGAMPKGEVRDVRPAGFPHPVWRSGLAIGFPFFDPSVEGGTPA